jgi:hypothetical protein
MLVGFISSPAVATSVHQYSLDSDARRHAYFGIAVLSGAVPGVALMAIEWVRNIWSSFPVVAWPLSMGATFGLLFMLLDRFAWRAPPIRNLLGVPDLSGTWDGSGLSSYQLEEDTGEPTAQFNLVLTIRQTFTRIEFHAETEHSTSRSTMASISTDHAVPIVRYAYENIPKNRANAELQRHPGLMELRYASDGLTGDYFNGKHRLRFGELTLRRRSSHEA